jgi:multiple sugar transport system substrate-binding protein
MAALICFILILSGCSGKAAVQNAEPKAGLPPEPITLKINNFNTAISQEDIESNIIMPVKKKYPHISFEFLDQLKGSTLQNLITAGNVPDIVFTDYPNLSGLLEFDYPQDLNEFVKAKQVTLGGVNPQMIEGGKRIGTKGELYALPFYMDRMMLFYNKDLFQKFGVPYPTDDMNYDEFIALVKRMTRLDGGVQYAGMRTINLHTTGTQWGYPVIDPKTGTASLQTDSWKKALTLFNDINSIPGNEKLTNETFYKEQRLAMLQQSFSIMVGLLEGVRKSGSPLNWDIAAMPQSSDAPGVSGFYKPYYFVISKSSKHKEAAFDAVAHLMNSKDVQLNLSKNGKMTILNDTEINKQFGNAIEGLTGKNVEAVFKHKSADLAYSNEFDKLASPQLNTAGTNVITGKSDMNSALRAAEEAANKSIAEKKK